LSSIEQQFADNLIPEFIMYWQEEGKAHNSWNSKFFQHVKYQWQKKVNENILPKDIEKRVESSWKIEPAINKEKKLPLSKENQEVNRNKFNKISLIKIIHLNKNLGSQRALAIGLKHIYIKEKKTNIYMQIFQL
jgi:hypothetical protein